MNRYKLHDIRDIQFYMMPKTLFESPYRESLSPISKIVYAFLLDRLELSRQNGWADSDGNVYLIYSRENLSEDVGVHVNTLTKVFKELTDMKLILEERRGLGMPNIIYVGKIDSAITNNVIQNHKDCGTEPQNMCSNNTNINNTKINKTERKEDMSPTKQQTLIRLPSAEKKAPSVKKKMTHFETAQHHIEQASIGMLNWDKVTDRDFTLYYQHKHEQILSQQIQYDMYQSVKQFRDWFINKYDIPKEHLVNFIDMMLVVYRDKDIQSQKHHSLTFSMFTQSRQQDMISRLVTRTKYELDRMSADDSTRRTRESEQSESVSNEVF